MRIFALLFLLVVSNGCAGLPSLEKIQHSFVREHPEAMVVEVSGQSTNNIYAEFHIHYTKAGDSLKHEDVWYYRHTAEAWILGKKESVR
jgi:hypothetical protein